MNNDMNNDINAIKRILLMFISHIKYSGELYPFRPEEKEELIDFAISWLKTMDPSTLTKCDQCKYRRTGLDEEPCRSCWQKVNYNYPNFEANNMAIEAFDRQIEGEWIKGFGNTSCECSKCGGNGYSQYKYCPWCGERKGV